jgi:hypothetical protein
MAALTAFMAMLVSVQQEQCVLFSQSAVDIPSLGMGDYNQTILTSTPAKCRVRDETPNLGPRYYNVLLDQGCLSSHGTVTDEYGEKW